MYSIAWMENAENSDLVSETLRKQFKVVRDRASANHTYLQVRAAGCWLDGWMDGSC